MRIRRILHASIVAIVCSVLLVTSTIVTLRVTDSRHATAVARLNAAVRKITLIRGFLPDAADANFQSASRQWQTQYAELTPMLAALPALDGPARAVNARILQEHAAVGALFARLYRGDAGAAHRETQAMVGGQLDVRTASMAADVLALNDLTNDRIRWQKAWLLALLSASVMVLAGASLALLLILQRRVARPIAALEQATLRVSAGRLDSPVSIAGNDELAALARSFDAMRIALRQRLAELAAAQALVGRENERLAQRVQERTAELQAANEELESFVHAVSHDLRAPLRALDGFSRALQEDYGGQLTGQARVYLAQISAASLQMGDLIEGLLVLSRATRAPMRRDCVDLSRLAGLLLAELQALEPQRKVAWEVEPGMQIEGDARMIEVVMRNLIGNAWKYSSRTPQARIRVRSRQAAGALCCCVSDNGAGFDPGKADRLFQPFQRLHAPEEFPGIGIGLATVQRIVRRHGGTISVDAAPGRGATLCFSLQPAELRHGEPAQ